MKYFQSSLALFSELTNNIGKNSGKRGEEFFWKYFFLYYFKLMDYIFYVQVGSKIKVVLV